MSRNLGKLISGSLCAASAAVWLPNCAISQDYLSSDLPFILGVQVGGEAASEVPDSPDVAAQVSQVAPESGFVAVQVYMPRPRPRPDYFDFGFAERPVARPENLRLSAAQRAHLSALADARAAADAAEVTNVADAEALALGEAVAAVAAQDLPASPVVDLPAVEAPVEPAVEPVVVAEPALAVAPVIALEEAPGEAEAPLDPLPLVLTGDFVPEAFKAYRRRFEQEFVALSGDEQLASGMELARLLLSQMLLPEARSYLNALQGMGAAEHPTLGARFKALRYMHAVLAEGEWPAALPEGWQEGSLWAQAAHAGTSEIGSEVTLLEAISQLQNHSEPVISRLLPELFDVALKQGDLRLAEGLLKGAREATKLLNTPLYFLMMGRLAYAYDLPQDAFDYYARAANGRDIHAQRARIAMADLALMRRDAKLLPALRDILSEGVNQWRHDREALVMRARLAQVAEDLGDIPTALDIMGKIRLDHPHTPEAILAHERGALALAAFALAMDREEIDLSSYLQTLRRIEPFYRLDPVWPIARAALGRAWARKGLYRTAAAEFGMGQIDWLRIGAPRPQLHSYFDMPLAEAETRLANFDKAGAQKALGRTGLPSLVDLQPRWSVAALRAGVPGALSSDQLAEADPERLMLYARAVREAGFKGDAYAAHRTLADKGALNTDLTEALHAVVGAHAMGDRAFARETYESLKNAPQAVWSFASPALLSAMVTPMPELQPLSVELSMDLLDRSDAALKAADVLLAQPIVPPPRQEPPAGAGDFVKQSADPLAARAAEAAP